MPMYNLTEYSSNYSEKTGILWFYFKDEATHAKLLGNTIAQLGENATNGILRNATIAIPVKYSSSFWRSVETSLINCKVELKLRWTKYCVLSGTDNVNGNDSDNIIFTIKNTKLVTLSARGNRKLSKLLSKGFERSVYWNEYKRKTDNKNTTNEFRYFLESNFAGVNRIFVSVYLNHGNENIIYQKV